MGEGKARAWGPFKLIQGVSGCVFTCALVHPGVSGEAHAASLQVDVLLLCQDFPAARVKAASAAQILCDRHGAVHVLAKRARAVLQTCWSASGFLIVSVGRRLSPIEPVVEVCSVFWCA